MIRRRFDFIRDSLTLQIALLVVVVEIAVLSIVGFIYTTTFTAQVDERVRERVTLPGNLMANGALSLFSISSESIMSDLVGDALLNGFVIAANQVVFYSLDPDLIGQSAAEVRPVDEDLLNPAQVEERLIERENSVISITPIIAPDGQTLRFWVYTEVSTVFANAQKAAIRQVFILGSLATIAASTLLIYLVFNRTLLTRLRNTIEVVQEVEKENLDARIPYPEKDELGQLQRGINQMVDRIRGLVNDLEKRVEERTRELRAAQGDAETANAAKTTFLSNMSHELRTPLNMVIGYTSAMLEVPEMYGNEKLPEAYRGDIRIIQQNGRYLLSLINDLLDLSKIEANKLDMEFTVVDPVPVFEGVIATMVGLVVNKPVELRSNYPRHLPPVYADPTRFRQMLLNLMSNAVKYTEEGTVTLEAHLDGPHRLRIAVTDTGVGIPADALDTIFDRFEQIKRSARGRSVQGTGLGLDITQQLARMHGTSIQIESKLNEGSTFSFSIRLATQQQIVQHAADTEHRADETTAIESAATVGALVLLAIRGNERREKIRQQLEKAEHVVVEASDMETIPEMALGLLPDAVILTTANVHLVAELIDEPELGRTRIVVIGDVVLEEHPRLHVLDGRTGMTLLVGRIQDILDQAVSSPETE